MNGETVQVLRRAAAVLEARYGLRFDAHNEHVLAQGLARAARRVALAPAALVERAEAGEDAAAALFHAVTIRETALFRHPEHFELLERHVLPKLVSARGGSGLRAWSAGCSTGEEAYSLASVLAGALGGFDGVEVLGTDANPAALEVARRAQYRRTPSDTKSRLGVGLPAGPHDPVTIHPRLRACVRFRALNLAQPNAYAVGSYDLILCRNVLMYLTRAAASRALAQLAECLNDDGYLLVSALDLDACPPQLEVEWIDRVMLLRHRAASMRSAATAAAPAPFLAEQPPAIATAESPQSARDLHADAVARFDEGRAAEAAALWRLAAAADPALIAAHLGLGMAGEPDEAEGHLHVALELLTARAETEPVAGAEPLTVAWARRLARRRLAELRGASAEEAS